MRKILLMSFVMTFTILLGVTLAYDGRDQLDTAEQARIDARIKAELERQEALKTLTLPYKVRDGMIVSEPASYGGGYPSILVDCPPGGIAEGEPDCYFNYDDVYNSGCNADTTPYPYFDVVAGDTICGRTGVFQHEIPGPPLDTTYYRDTDWYRVVVSVPSELTWAGTGDFPLQLLLMDAGTEDCEDYEQLGSAVAAIGDTGSITATVWPGVYWMWAGPDAWYTDLLCDGSGAMGNEYVAWVTVEPTPPCVVNTAIGDINTAVPYADLGNTSCGAGHNYDGPDCNGIHWNGGEDYVYEFTVSDPIVLDIILDPDTTMWTSLVIDDFCPPDPNVNGCVAISRNSTNPAVPHGIAQLLLQPGTYYVYVDKWSPTDCIENYDLYIVEGVQTVGLAETGNIPDCGVSNFGALGETDAQGNTYGWGGNDPANFAGTLVMGNATDMMFSFYNQGVTDCYEYRGVTGLNMIDPYHPTSRYDDNDNLGGLSIEYCGHGYVTSPEDDIFVHSFKLTNNSGSTISDFYAGVFFDWDIDTDGGDTVRFDWTNNVMIQSPLADTIFYGLCLANAAQVNLNSMTAVSQQDHIYPTGPSGGGWLMSELYTLMSTPGDSIADSMFSDMSSLLSTGPHTITDGDSVTINIAVIGGASLTDVQSRAATAAGLVIPDCNVGEPPPPYGRCCYVDASDTLCVENLEGECTSLGGYDWNQYLNCTNHPCVVTGCPYVPGDVNGSDSYNGLDITFGVAYFKGGTAPLCPACPIPACNTWHYCGDVNGSCSFNGLDITYGVAYFKGGPGPIYCDDCPPI